MRPSTLLKNDNKDKMKKSIHIYIIYVLSTVLSFCCTQPAKSQNKVNDIESVYAPIIVGVPPSDSYIGLSLMPDGEVRHYNYGEQAEEDRPLYLSSKDHGLSWEKVYLPKELIYADQQSPVSHEYIRLFCANNKVYAMRTEGGLEGGRTITKIDDKAGIMNKPPIFIRGGKRIISAAHRTDRSGAFVYYSDDDGKTWKASTQVTAPPHVKGGFHQGTRWNHGAVEPTVVELSDGRLWMIVRTAQDRHYQSFSTDGGETWSEATPSPFYGTITMPTLFRMQDGRLLFFWCNTTPLPELATANGVWDDVFTNRDVLHVALSTDDGKTWKGFRELILNPERDARDYGSSNKGMDKSVHQVQAVEVVPGKVLVSAGQSAACRKMIVFDPNWLNEPTRFCDFSNGLEDWSTFRYYKGIVGHCCYDRKAADMLVTHPEDNGRKVLNIKYHPNDSLVQDNEGAVWNFPAAQNGFVNISFKLPEGAQNVDLILNDRWFNPTDTVAKHECIYTLPLNRHSLKVKDSKWHKLSIYWKKDRGAEVYIDGKKRKTLPAVSKTENGISYIHFLGGHVKDDKGILIEWIEAGKDLL